MPDYSDALYPVDYDPSDLTSRDFEDLQNLIDNPPFDSEELGR
jgi:hypothetical protein